VTSTSAPQVLVTGFPGALARPLLAQLARGARQTEIFLLVEAERAREAAGRLTALGRLAARCHLLTGDITAMHLGLSGTEYRQLTSGLREIFHLAALCHPAADPGKLWRVNVTGTKNLLDVASDSPRLERFNHVSTCFVSGDRLGIICEDELECGQTFRDPYQQTKFEAERVIARARPAIPITIYRPSIACADPSPGPHPPENFYGRAIREVLRPSVRVASDAPVQVVPPGYVVSALLHLAREPKAKGRTFHLVDPQPWGQARTQSWLASRTLPGRPPPRVPPAAIGNVERLRRFLSPPGATSAGQPLLTFYECGETLELLRKTRIQCPPAPAAAEALRSLVTEAQGAGTEFGVEDALDPGQS
jgi:thioester reductase-like protein